LGDDAAYHLIMVIPKLSRIVTRDPRYQYSMNNQDSLHAVQRLRYFLDQFVDIIVMNSNVAVTLFLDNMHNADAASVLLLNQLVMKGRKNLFFLTCSRDDDTGSHHPFWDMVDNSGAFGITTTKVQLGCMSEETLNIMVSNLLCRPPRLVRKLSGIVYRKTQGNTLFFYQMMLSLYRYGLLTLSLSQKRWDWDENAIESMKLPDDVARCFLDGINRLPLEVKSALHTLSCFGAQTPLKHMELLEESLGLSLTRPLDKAALEGFVSKLKGEDGLETYTFCHDLLEQTAYDMIQEEIRFKEHSLYGLSLVQHSIESDSDDLLFVAVKQINLGGRESVTVEQHVNVAGYNLRAGKKAIQMSDFVLASSFLLFGIKFLPENRWRDHYELSLEMYETATKAALATGDTDSLLTYSGEVLKYSRCFEDKLETYFLIMSSLGHSINASIAMDKGLEILSQLGENLPKDLSQQDLLHQAMQTHIMIKDLSQTDLLNYKLMTDKKKLWAMKSLAKMMVIALSENPILQPALVLKMVQLTITHGKLGLSAYVLKCV
jgi:predicted ATPase